MGDVHLATDANVAAEKVIALTGEQNDTSLRIERADLEAALRSIQAVNDAEVRRLWRLIEELEVHLCRVEEELREQRSIPRGEKKLAASLKEARRSIHAIYIERSKERKRYDERRKEAELAREEAAAARNALEKKETDLKAAIALKEAQKKELEALQLEAATLKARNASQQLNMKKLQEELDRAWEEALAVAKQNTALAAAQEAEKAAAANAATATAATAASGMLQSTLLDDMRKQIESNLRNELQGLLAQQLQSQGRGNGGAAELYSPSAPPSESTNPAVQAPWGANAGSSAGGVSLPQIPPWLRGAPVQPPYGHAPAAGHAAQDGRQRSNEQQPSKRPKR